MRSAPSPEPSSARRCRKGGKSSLNCVDPPAVNAMNLFRNISGLWPAAPWRPELIGPGSALVGYGCYFRDDLGWTAYGVIGLGIVVATVGQTAFSWAVQAIEQWPDWLDETPRSLPPELALERAWRRFWWSLAAMSALGAFSLWRAQVTV